MLALGIAPAGCGGAGYSPRATTPQPPQPYDTRDSTLACIREQGLAARKAGKNLIRVGDAPGDPEIVFAATIGGAEAEHLTARAAGAEVISDTLLFVRRGSDEELDKLESCLGRRPFEGQQD